MSVGCWVQEATLVVESVDIGYASFDSGNRLSSSQAPDRLLQQQMWHQQKMLWPRHLFCWNVLRRQHTQLNKLSTEIHNLFYWRPNVSLQSVSYLLQALMKSLRCLTTHMYTTTYFLQNANEILCLVRTSQQLWRDIFIFGPRLHLSFLRTTCNVMSRKRRTHEMSMNQKVCNLVEGVRSANSACA